MDFPHIQITRETHETPEWASARLLTLGGRNRFGGPNFRCVWGWNRLDWVGGKFEDRDDDGNLIREVLGLRRMPRYPNCNRWYVEQWLPPEKYGSPENWMRQTREWGEEGNIPQLGPYPSLGEYEMLSVLETESGEFVQLTPLVLDEIIWALRTIKKRGYQEGVRARKALAEKRRQEAVKFGHEYLNEATLPLFNDKQFVTVL